MSKEYFIHHNRAYDFWAYVYKSLHIQSYHTSYFQKTMEVYNKLSKYHDEDGYTLRCVINAIHNASNYISHTYPIERIPSNHMKLMCDLYLFARDFGYYPWDVASCPTGEEIAYYFLEHKTYPVVVPFVRNADDNKSFSSILISDEVEHHYSKSFVEEILPSISQDASQANCLSINLSKETIDYERSRAKAIIQVLKNGKIIPSKQIALAKKRKKIENYSYRGLQSDWQRIIGLILWDIWSETEEAWSDEHFPVAKIRNLLAAKERIYIELDKIRIPNLQGRDTYEENRNAVAKKRRKTKKSHCTDLRRLKKL